MYTTFLYPSFLKTTGRIRLVVKVNQKSEIDGFGL